MRRTYQQLIFTNHAWDRLQERSISPDAIWQTVQAPSQQVAMGDEKTKYIRTVGGRLIHVVASWLPHERQWLVVSVWVRGENDKVPLIWQLITLPFKLIAWLLKLLWKLIFKTRHSKQSF
jgi:hypothetical protein